METSHEIDDGTRHLVTATQGGLPLCVRPYAALAEELGVSQDEVLARLSNMIGDGRIRRIAAVPNHYALGFRANGMSVWDVADEDARGAVTFDHRDQPVGQRVPAPIDREVGDLPFVSHCYLRPRHPPLWPYNLFAMVHGHCREEVEDRVQRIAEILGERQRARDVLYSKRILKKTGMRLNGGK